MQFGSAPHSVLPPIKELEQEGKISTCEVEYHGYPKIEFLALQRPDTFRSLRPGEISLVDDEIQYVVEQHTATSISKESHDEI